MERFNNRTNGYHIFHNYYKKKKEEEKKTRKRIPVKNSYHIPLIQNHNCIYLLFIIFQLPSIYPSKYLLITNYYISSSIAQT